MSTYFDTRKRPMPFLEVSQSSIEYISSHLKKDTADIVRKTDPSTGRKLSNEKDVENIITFWTTLTKASDVIQNGKRLENMSWRLINRKLILDNDITSSDFSAIVSVSKGTKCKELKESQYHRRKMQKRISSTAGSNEYNPPTSSSSIHTNSSSSLNTSSLTSSCSNSNNLRGNSASKKKSAHTSSPPPPIIPPPPTAAPPARVPSLFKKTSPQLNSTANTPEAPLEKSTNERKTKFFIDQSSPESSSMSPRSLSPRMGAKESITKVIENSNDKIKQEKHHSKASNAHAYNHTSTMVASLFGGGKNNSLHSLVNQVQRNQIRRPDPAIPNNTARPQTDSKNHTATGTAKVEQHLQPEARTKHPSLFGKDRTATPAKPQNLSCDAIVQKQHSSLHHHNVSHQQQQQQQQQLQQLQQRHQQRLQQLQQQQQQLHNVHHPLLRNNSGGVKTQNSQIKSSTSQLSMVSAASSEKSQTSQVSQTSRMSLFPTKKPNSAVYSLSGNQYDDDDDYDYDYDDDSGWSSLSDDENDEDEKEESGLSFQKQNVVTDDESGNKTKPALKRSLLSGLFLDKMDKEHSDTNTEENSNHKLAEPDAKIRNERGNSELHSSLTSPRLSDGTRNTTTSLFHPVTRQASTQKGHYDSHHRSNAPPTAATLLPTALATHMFLPTKNFQTFQSVQRQQYSGHSQKPHIGQHKPHANHQSPNSENQQQKHAPFGDGDGQITKLTKDNIAKYANSQTIKPGINAGGESEVEYASSIKTSTSSIDIPGSQNRIMKEQRRKEKLRELDTKRSAGGENGDGVSGTEQLPSNLVDSINKENMTLFGHITRKPTTSSIHGSDTCDDPDISSTVVEIANQHLDQVSTTEKDDDPIFPIEKRAAIFTSDGFIDDSIVRKIYGGPADVDDDDLNYHARGW